ncbi:MAG: hypothetical protein JXA90_12450, partial [Planctomycetes bacterium]|nr:hypothetical protein [Planctomycetota bacterium]
MARQFLLQSLVVLFLTALASGSMSAQPDRENGADEPPPTTAQAPSPGGASRLERYEYSGLWPFYSRERYESGRVRVSSLFQAIRFERDPSGDYHHRVLPFYSASLRDAGTDFRLGLYPLLYHHRDSPRAGHDIVLPLFYRWRRDEASHTLLWPLAYAARNPSRGAYRMMPVIF